MITKPIIDDLVKEFNSEVQNMTYQQVMNYALDGFISRAIRANYVQPITENQNEVQQEETV